MALIPATLSRIMTLDNSDAHTLFISEIGGSRHFQIQIGTPEALSLAHRLDSGSPFTRPLTHDLLLNSISALGGKLREIQITGIRAGTYFAELVVDTADGEVRLDSRPSDAMVLAAQEKVPLMVDDDVFDMSAS